MNQLIELSKLWKAPRRMDIGKYVCDIALGYAAWRSNKIKDMVQPVNLLSKRMLTKAKILRSKFEAERKMTNQKILRLQKDLRQSHYDMEIQRDKI